MNSENLNRGALNDTNPLKPRPTLMMHINSCIDCWAIHNYVSQFIFFIWHTAILNLDLIQLFQE